LIENKTAMELQAWQVLVQATAIIALTSRLILLFYRANSINTRSYHASYRNQGTLAHPLLK
jgi:hypothetical protein